MVPHADFLDSLVQEPFDSCWHFKLPTLVRVLLCAQIFIIDNVDSQIGQNHQVDLVRGHRFNIFARANILDVHGHRLGEQDTFAEGARNLADL